MLMALLRGKLSRDQENMEDILTSNVFGTFKYLPPQDALLPFLSNAALLNGEMPLASLPGHAEVKYKFWPRLEEPDCEGCEPDVLIFLKLPGGSEKKLILVEAKYLSGKSSEEGEGARPHDQLAREWDNLRALAARESAASLLIYLTADLSPPIEDIEASQKELEGKREQRGQICWLSWRHLRSLTRTSSHEMLRDLGEVLHHLNLTFFEGFSGVEAPRQLRWTFSGPSVHFVRRSTSSGGLWYPPDHPYGGSTNERRWQEHHRHDTATKDAL